MQWVWDEQKATANFAKHGVQFETAVEVFADPSVVILPDPHPDDDRWQAIGMVGSMTLFVIHTIFEDDGSARVISARRATPAERRMYAQARF